MAAVVLLLGLLTPSAFAGSRSLRPVAWLLSVIQIGNGLFHLGGSLAARRLLPGTWSAPLLLATGLWLGYATSRLP